MIRYSNPNDFYYRHTDPTQHQAQGRWTDEEHNIFLNRVRQFQRENWKLGSSWGLFSNVLPHRCGYQCSNYYRKLVEIGVIQDSDYGFNDTGALRQISDTKLGNIPPPSENRLSPIWETEVVKNIAINVNRWLLERDPTLDIAHSHPHSGDSVPPISPHRRRFPISPPSNTPAVIVVDTNPESLSSIRRKRFFSTRHTTQQIASPTQTPSKSLHNGGTVNSDPRAMDFRCSICRYPLGSSLPWKRLDNSVSFAHISCLPPKLETLETKGEQLSHTKNMAGTSTPMVPPPVSFSNQDQGQNTPKDLSILNIQTQNFFNSNLPKVEIKEHNVPSLPVSVSHHVHHVPVPDGVFISTGKTPTQTKTPEKKSTLFYDVSDSDSNSDGDDELLQGELDSLYQKDPDQYPHPDRVALDSLPDLLTSLPNLSESLDSIPKRMKSNSSKTIVDLTVNNTFNQSEQEQNPIIFLDLLPFSLFRIRGLWTIFLSNSENQPNNLFLKYAYLFSLVLITSPNLEIHQMNFLSFQVAVSLARIPIPGKVGIDIDKHLNLLGRMINSLVRYLKDDTILKFDSNYQNKNSFIRRKQSHRICTLWFLFFHYIISRLGKTSENVSKYIHILNWSPNVDFTSHSDLIAQFSFKTWILPWETKIPDSSSLVYINPFVHFSVCNGLVDPPILPNVDLEILSHWSCSTQLILDLSWVERASSQLLRIKHTLLLEIPLWKNTIHLFQPANLFFLFESICFAGVLGIIPIHLVEIYWCILVPLVLDTFSNDFSFNLQISLSVNLINMIITSIVLIHQKSKNVPDSTESESERERERKLFPSWVHNLLHHIHAFYLQSGFSIKTAHSTNAVAITIINSYPKIAKYWLPLVSHSLSLNSLYASCSEISPFLSLLTDYQNTTTTTTSVKSISAKFSRLLWTCWKSHPRKFFPLLKRHLIFSSLWGKPPIAFNPILIVQSFFYPHQLLLNVDKSSQYDWVRDPSPFLRPWSLMIFDSQDSFFLTPPLFPSGSSEFISYILPGNNSSLLSSSLLYSVSPTLSPAKYLSRIASKSKSSSDIDLISDSDYPDDADDPDSDSEDPTIRRDYGNEDPFDNTDSSSSTSKTKTKIEYFPSDPSKTLASLLNQFSKVESSNIQFLALAIASNSFQLLEISVNILNSSSIIPNQVLPVLSLVFDPRLVNTIPKIIALLAIGHFSKPLFTFITKTVVYWFAFLDRALSWKSSTVSNNVTKSSTDIPQRRKPVNYMQPILDVQAFQVISRMLFIIMSAESTNFASKYSNLAKGLYFKLQSTLYDCSCTHYLSPPMWEALFHISTSSSDFPMVIPSSNSVTNGNIRHKNLKEAILKSECVKSGISLYYSVFFQNFQKSPPKKLSRPRDLLETLKMSKLVYKLPMSQASVILSWTLKVHRIALSALSNSAMTTGKGSTPRLKSIRMLPLIEYDSSRFPLQFWERIPNIDI